MGRGLLNYNGPKMASFGQILVGGSAPIGDRAEYCTRYGTHFSIDHQLLMMHNLALSICTVQL